MSKIERIGIVPLGRAVKTSTKITNQGIVIPREKNTCRSRQQLAYPIEENPQLL